MTDNPQTKPRWGWLPQLRSRWWTLLLGLSLMLNLMVGGIVFGDRFGGGRADRLMGASYVQLIPRNFFRQLSHDRRKQLMEIVRESRDDLRGLRSQYEGTSVKLAEVLEKDTFSPEELRQSVSAFSTGTESLAARGGEVVIKIVNQLTPEERKQLAQAIRQRDAMGRNRRGN
jgi:uncharacterized membrane protein